MIVTSYGRNKNLDDEIKKHSGTSPDVQFKKFPLTKQKKLDLERTMSELGAPLRKKSDRKIEKTVNIKVKFPYVNKKPLTRIGNLVQAKKLGLERTMNELGKPFRKKSDPRNKKKTLKIKAKLPHVNKKPPARKRFFVQTSFSHSTSKLERKNFTSQTHWFFRSNSCFGLTKITTPN